MSQVAPEPPFSVSVVVPAYNIDKYVGRAIESALAQTRPADEIIVVNDGSTDNTAAVVKQYGTKVRYIYQENAGLSAARNTAIKAARCQWMALLDGDDEWLPRKLELQMELLQRNPKLMWATCNFTMHSCSDNRQLIYLDPRRGQALLGEKEYLESYFQAVNSGVGTAPFTMIIKREVFEQVGLFQVGLRFGEDIDMYWRIAYRWPQIAFVSAPLGIYYLYRPGSLTHSTAPQQRRQIEWNLYRQHIHLATNHGKWQELKPFISRQVCQWIYTDYFNRQFAEVRSMLRQYDQVLPKRFQRLMSFLTRLPRVTAPIVHMVYRIVRAWEARPNKRFTWRLTRVR